MLVASAILAFSLSGVEMLPAATASEADTIEIIGLLLKDRLGATGEEPAGGYLVVAAETIVLCPPNAEEGDDDAWPLSAIQEPGLLPEVTESMQRALLCEQEGGMLPSANFENAQVVLASQIQAIFSGNGWWDDFYRTFPGSRGLVEFTAPSYSDDGRHAVIYVSHSCGGLCGTGWLVSLSKAKDKWKIAGRRMLWIS